MTKSTII